MVEQKAEQKQQKSATITPKAYEIASKVDAMRKEKGMSSSIAAVISEAIVNQFGDVVDG